MTEAAELREHAERCRRLAASATNRDYARILEGLADDYLARAKRLEQQAALSQTPPAVAEQQPMQQQQQVQPKKEDE
jgi:hypothetical protein